MSRHARTVVDPVCGMVVDPRRAIVVTYHGRAYHFCEHACAELFRDEPERWAHEAGGPFEHTH